MIDNKQIIISEIDKQSILDSNVKIAELDKLIFRFKKVHGTGCFIYHKNGDPLDFRRSNLIMAPIDIRRYKDKITMLEFCGIHMGPSDNSYELITFENNKLITENGTVAKELILKLDNWKKRNIDLIRKTIKTQKQF